jgi:hypothetical protein
MSYMLSDIQRSLTNSISRHTQRVSNSNVLRTIQRRLDESAWKLGLILNIEGVGRLDNCQN